MNVSCSRPGLAPRSSSRVKFEATLERSTSPAWRRALALVFAAHALAMLSGCGFEWRPSGDGQETGSASESSSGTSAEAPAPGGAESSPEASLIETSEPLEWAIVISGGASNTSPSRDEASEIERSLRQQLEVAGKRLAEGGAALEVATSVVAALEDDPRFNAGRGATFTTRGTHEHDAGIMDGRSLASGACAATRNVRNPIELARRIMESGTHPLVVGDAADRLASTLGVRKAPQNEFTTDQAMRQWQRLRSSKRRNEPLDDITRSVGAVVLDRYGNLAAAASTGGLGDRLAGTVGAAGLVGSGVYARNAAAAVVACGRDRDVVGAASAHEVAARVQLAGETLESAVAAVLELQGGGCIVAVDHHGRSAVAHSTPHMASASADASGRSEIEVTLPGG